MKSRILTSVLSLIRILCCVVTVTNLCSACTDENTADEEKKDILCKHIWMATNRMNDEYLEYLSSECLNFYSFSKVGNMELRSYYHIAGNEADTVNGNTITISTINYPFYELNENILLIYYQTLRLSCQILTLVEDTFEFQALDDEYGWKYRLVRPSKFVSIPIPSVWETQETNVEEYEGATWTFDCDGYYTFTPRTDTGEWKQDNFSYIPLGEYISSTQLPIKRVTGEWLWKVDISDSTMVWETCRLNGDYKIKFRLKK